MHPAHECTLGKMSAAENLVADMCNENQYYYTRMKLLERQVELAAFASKMSIRIRRALLERLRQLRIQLDAKTQRLEALLLASQPSTPPDPLCTPPLYCVACYAKIADWAVYHNNCAHLSLCHDCAARSPAVCPTCREPGKLIRIYHAGVSPYSEHDLV